jgi:hypothetical protein
MRLAHGRCVCSEKTLWQDLGLCHSILCGNRLVTSSLLGFVWALQHVCTVSAQGAATVGVSAFCGYSAVAGCNNRKVTDSASITLYPSQMWGLACSNIQRFDPDKISASCGEAERKLKVLKTIL